jgi:hypothetical protein
MTDAPEEGADAAKKVKNSETRLASREAYKAQGGRKSREKNDGGRDKQSNYWEAQEKMFNQ